MDPRPPRQPDDLPPPFPRDAFDPVGAERVVRIGDGGELAAALPVLVGFRPSESVVLVALGGDSGRRVGLTARVDIPPARSAAELAEVLAERLAHERPESALLAVVSEAPDVDVLPELPDRNDGGAWTDLPHRELVHQLLLALDARSIPLREALLVRGGRWWSYDCAEACCAPGAGTALPSGTSPLAAASVAAGQVVARDREELELRIAPVGAPGAAAMARAVTAVGEDLADLGPRRGRDAAADRYREWVEAAVDGCGDRGSRPGDEAIARVGWGLCDVRVRDHALCLALGPRSAEAELLWTECTRRLPGPLDAAPATLLAVSAWLRGDGATARIALERALDSQPGYALADLLVRGMEAGLGPRDLRSLVAATQVDLDLPPEPQPDLDALVAELMRAATGDEQAAPAGRVRAARAAASPRPGRARPERRARSRTRRPRSPE